MILNVYNRENSWVVGGLEELMKPNPNAPTTKIALDYNKLHSVLPAQVNVNKSILNAQDKDLQVVMPFNFKLANNADKIEGSLISDKLTLSGFPYDLPPLSFNADYTINAEQLTANLKAQSAKKDYQLSLKLTAPVADIMSGKVVIDTIQFPWGKGQISAKAVTLPLNMKKPVKITLNLKEIDLETLLGSFTDGKINGEGKISGSLPITYYPDGKITLQKGSAQAKDKGVLVISPDLLPGDNQQLATARTTLENFHYTTLKIAVSSDEKQQSVIHLTVEGSNPDANDGRQVKLNVNLSGDLIPLIQQSLLAINDLKQLLHIEEK
jgi:hypothetical protein